MMMPLVSNSWWEQRMTRLAERVKLLRLPLAYMRGRTLDLPSDEAQKYNHHAK